MQPLTPRELDIITAVQDGHTANKEIARLLEIRKRTVEKHLERIKQKTGVRKAGLPYWAKRNLGDEYGENSRMVARAVSP